MQVLKETDFEFKGQKSVYHGKVRDVYNIEDKYMVMVATDRISAFDAQSDCGVFPRLHEGYSSQLETCLPGSDGDSRSMLRASQDRDDCTRLYRRFRMARLQGRRP